MDDFMSKVAGHLQNNTLEQFVDQLSEQYRPPEGELTTPTKLLLADLYRARTLQNATKVDQIIAKAKKEEYHDFLSPHACPLLLLVGDLTEARLTDLATKVKEGVYDA